MENFILVICVLLAIAIVGLIMLQQGKGAEMGASFGAGSSQTLFGAAGAGNFFSRLTGILTALFFVCCLALAYIAKKSSVIDESFAPAGDAAVLESTQDAAPTDAAAALESAPATAEAALEAASDEVKKSADEALKALESTEQSQ
jgi:preprotein translocase subunit SecG